MASVDLDLVRKTYPNGFEAVRSVSLKVANGAFTVLLGPSGCGKSTLLRMIAGLERVTSGTIRIGDRIVNEIEPADRDIAMVFQNYALYPHMSVYDNMAYGLRNRRTPKPEIERRVREAARLLEIEPMLDRKPRQLSGGQRQRVAMGRAIVRDPQVFLFDEPLSNLDAKLRVTMRMEIRRLHNRIAATSIFVTHDQVEAMTLADQVVVMNAGQIEQVGTPTEIYRRPATRFVAGFIGSPGMNLMAGTVVAPGIAELTGGGRLPFDAGAITAAPGAAVEVGVRPEDFVFEAQNPAAGSPGGIAFEREIIEELGATRVVLGHGAGTTLAVAVPASTPLPDGPLLRVKAPAAAVHLYDAETGRTLRNA